MKKLLFILIIAGICWYLQNSIDIEAFKENALNVMSQEKTINTVNTTRAHAQQDINKI